MTMSGTECLISNILEVKQLKIGHYMISCHCRQTLTQGIREAESPIVNKCSTVLNGEDFDCIEVVSCDKEGFCS